VPNWRPTFVEGFRILIPTPGSKWVGRSSKPCASLASYSPFLSTTLEVESKARGAGYSVTVVFKVYLVDFCAGKLRMKKRGGLSFVRLGRSSFN